MPTIKGKLVESEELEFGVRFDDGFIAECYNEQEAQSLAAMTGGKILIRDVFYCAWAELAE